MSQIAFKNSSGEYVEAGNTNPLPIAMPAGSTMSGTAPVVADSTASDVPTLVADFNALLAALRTRGVIS